ncbi:K(+)-transporting ATPase subunit F [Streptomyces bathyalis]|uniref:K(+)-transporting ATPase subunit F n=1 Tax=Streptomyces bathyalis TaxID=2710756 RepID=A0A7T1T7C3_9ACTN|nr:K(+)-transporting ATPase subunit F [Streptomyces bathyalis]QPP07723.1 K(+)-transporting ATPase subunit F [Streptomyces bathyalis]
MSAENIAGLVLCVLVLGYLIVSLIFPERF